MKEQPPRGFKHLFDIESPETTGWGKLCYSAWFWAIAQLVFPSFSFNSFRTAVFTRLQRGSGLQEAKC
jgi:hypothetical protein